MYKDPLALLCKQERVLTDQLAKVVSVCMKPVYNADFKVVAHIWTSQEAEHNYRKGADLLFYIRGQIHKGRNHGRDCHRHC